MAETVYGLLFPGGRTRALTFSFDDGVVQDRKLVALFNRYGLKGTFNLNAGKLAPDGETVTDDATHRRLSRSEVQELYQGHEVAAHSYTHPWLNKCGRGEVMSEMLRDRQALEALAGYPVRGMAYPFGTHTRAVWQALRACGVVYGRTTGSEQGFRLPENPFAWSPTCHFFDPQLPELTRRFLSKEPAESGKHFTCGQPDTALKLMYVWGHSYECDTTKPTEDAPRRWAATEDMCRELSGHKSVWYATNIQIIDYLAAYDALLWSVDGSSVFNPSAWPVTLSTNAACLTIPSGAAARL